MKTMTRRSILLLTVAGSGIVLAACATGGGGGRSAPAASQAAGGGCPAPPTDVNRVVNHDRGAVDPGVLGSVSAGMCMSEVLSRLGPAHGDSAAGMVVLSWKSTDGRTLEVGAPTLREKAAFVRWAK
jgi:hypothetical protein